MSIARGYRLGKLESGSAKSRVSIVDLGWTFYYPFSFHLRGVKGVAYGKAQHLPVRINLLYSRGSRRGMYIYIIKVLGGVYLWYIGLF